MAEIKYEIIKRYGVFSDERKGWAKEVNLVAWNGEKPKVDIRAWSEDHSKMGKGITLTKDEAWELSLLLQEALEHE